MNFGRENEWYKVKIEQASEPEDVIWKNAGICLVILRYQNWWALH
jgi:hypothetical protein